MEIDVTLLAAFLAGLASFASPCVLPLVPSYLSFLTGTGLEDLKAERSFAVRARVVLHAVAFVAGFTTVFVALGLSAGALGGRIVHEKGLLAAVAGTVIVVLGLHMMGVLHIPLLMADKRVHLHGRRSSYGLSFVVGLGFAAGWSPCIGPILSAIYVLAAGRDVAHAAVLLFAYAAGLAVPFLIAALAITRTLAALGRITRYLPAIERTSGAILVATGLVVATGTFVRVTGYLYRFFPPSAS